MVIIKALLAGLLCVSFCMAISISGTVTDTGGNPIAGARVYLEQNKDSATSDVYGHFTISGVTGIKNQISQIVPKPSAIIQNGFLSVNLLENSAVAIFTYNLQGKLLATIQKTMNAGNQSVALPQMGAGVYLYKVKMGKDEILLKSNTVGSVSQGSVVNVQSATEHNALAKQAKVLSVITDVIASTKDGYLNYRCVQYSSDTTGIKIKMIVCADSVRDVDGNLYHAVRIGNRVWTVENLRTTKYNDKTAIPLVKDSAAWTNLSTSGYCYYNNMTNADSIKKWGALYNWSAVNTGKLAPAGWHVPTDAEWDTLQNYLITNGYNWDGTTTGNKIAKSLAAKTDWNSDTTTGVIGKDLTINSSSGFAAIPGGCRNSYGFFSGFGGIGYFGFWWSATKSNAGGAWFRYLYYGYNLLLRYYDDESCGFSVRLVKNY